jgi:hypothetical protein
MNRYIERIRHYNTCDTYHSDTLDMRFLVPNIVWMTIHIDSRQTWCRRICHLSWYRVNCISTCISNRNIKVSSSEETCISMNRVRIDWHSRIQIYTLRSNSRILLRNICDICLCCKFCSHFDRKDMTLRRIHNCSSHYSGHNTYCCSESILRSIQYDDR